MTTETFVLCKTSFDSSDDVALCHVKVIKCEWKGACPETFSVKVVKEMRTFCQNVDSDAAQAYSNGVKDGVVSAFDATVSAIGAEFNAAMDDWLLGDDEAGINDGYAPSSVERWKVKVLQFAFSDQSEAELMNVYGTLWAPEWEAKRAGVAK